MSRRSGACRSRHVRQRMGEEKRVWHPLPHPCASLPAHLRAATSASTVAPRASARARRCSTRGQSESRSPRPREASKRSRSSGPSKGGRRCPRPLSRGGDAPLYGLAKRASREALPGRRGVQPRPCSPSAREQVRKRPVCLLKITARRLQTSGASKTRRWRYAPVAQRDARMLPRDTVAGITFRRFSGSTSLLTCRPP